MNIKNRFHFIAATTSALLLSSLVGRAGIFAYSQPTFDKWAYPFAPSGGGGSAYASVFSNFENKIENWWDERDAQFMVGFKTSTDVPTGLGVTNYEILSVKLTLTLHDSTPAGLMYDSTYDSYTTYDTTNAGAPINGDDPGRPFELYGVGYRGGLSALTVTETSPFSFLGPQVARSRNFYASDYSGGVARDVSNNVGDGFEANPFAIGLIDAADLNPDGTMKGDTEVVFTLNLSNPDVMAYLLNAVNQGQLNLMVSAMFQAAQPGGGGTSLYPYFDTKETILGGAPRLSMEVNIVPEASSGLLAMFGGVFLLQYVFGRRNGKTS